MMNRSQKWEYLPKEKMLVHLATGGEIRIGAHYRRRLISGDDTLNDATVFSFRMNSILGWDVCIVQSTGVVKTMKPSDFSEMFELDEEMMAAEARVKTMRSNFMVRA